MPILQNRTESVILINVYPKNRPVSCLTTRVTISYQKYFGISGIGVGYVSVSLGWSIIPRGVGEGSSGGGVVSISLG